MGGGDWQINLVELTPEEHYLAHQLLVKMHPENKLLAYAAYMMTVTSHGNQKRSNKLYGWLKKRYNSVHRGRKLSAETRAKMSLARKGKKQSPEHIAARTSTMKGRVFSEETKLKMSRAAKNKDVSDVTKEKISKLFKGKKQSPEQIAKKVASYKATVESRNRNGITNLQ